MIVGRCGGQPAVVLLVDYINNGNRGGAEALYLFGKDTDANGLRILDGSTLYMGNLHVYALKDANMINLRTLYSALARPVPPLATGRSVWVIQMWMG